MPFKKGDPNINRNGAPKRAWTWSGVLEKAMEIKMTSKTGEERTVKQIVATSLIDQAINGNVVAAKEIMNRMDGMPKQETDITTGGDKINTLIVYKPDKNAE